MLTPIICTARSMGINSGSLPYPSSTSARLTKCHMIRYWPKSMASSVVITLIHWTVPPRLRPAPNMAAWATSQPTPTAIMPNWYSVTTTMPYHTSAETSPAPNASASALTALAPCVSLCMAVSIYVTQAEHSVMRMLFFPEMYFSCPSGIACRQLPHVAIMYLLSACLVPRLVSIMFTARENANFKALTAGAALEWSIFKYAQHQSGMVESHYRLPSPNLQCKPHYKFVMRKYDCARSRSFSPLCPSNDSIVLPG
jgi:hypothetical protein